MTAWTRDALTYETIVRQGLSSRRPLGAADTVRSILALQAQEPAAPNLALWNRIDGFDANDFDRALADGAIVKASLFRFTLHAIDADDLPWARAAMQSRVRDAGYHDILDDIGLTTQRVEQVLERLSTMMAEPHGNTDIERVLSEIVPEAGDPARLWSALRMVGAFRNAPTTDPWSFGRRPAFLPCTVAADDEQAATGELVRRYLRAFGPATIADMSQFTILKRSALREVVESMGDVVAVAGPDGAKLLDVDGGDGASDAELATLPPRLLGMWDSVLLAYADRSRVIPDEHRPHVIRRNGDVLPTVLVEGLVRGVWRASADAIEIRALDPLDDATLQRLDNEARDLRRLLADREPAVFSRFGRWWDRLPDGPTITIGS
ncbi:MAG: winged helix DNA-binding domain-containing protein [Ilumatobacteraceae bacterium]